MSTLSPTDRADRDDAAAFAGRVTRWDGAGPVRLRQDGELVRLWATTPFDTLVSRAVSGTVDPSDCTVHAGNLLSALAVSTAEAADLGPRIDAAWRSQLPPRSGWIPVDGIPATVLTELADQGVSAAQAAPGPAGASTSLLDSEVITVRGGGMVVPVPLRVLFALSGMGFAGQDAGELVHLRATDSWLRLDARFGSVLRRRHALLPLFV